MTTLHSLTPPSRTDTGLRSVFGLNHQEIERVMSVTGQLPTVFFNRLLRYLDETGALTLIEEWQQEERKAVSGRKAAIPSRAILLTFILNGIWGLGWGFEELSKTLVYRLTAEQREALGIIDDGADKRTWYHRAWRANKRILKLIDPWHMSSLRRKLPGAAFKHAIELYDKSREDRAHRFARVLTAGSLEMLPKHFLDNYRGDIALDSTAIIIQGRPNPNDRHRPDYRDRLNGDYQCGWYTRFDSHDGQDVPNSKPGYELDTTVLVDVKNGSFAFPLISAIYMHLPGQLRAGPQDTIEQHAELFDERGLVLVDRAFNNLKPEYFQEPVRRHRFDTVYDYRGNQLGPQGSVPGKPIIIIDGSPYVNLMPESYRMITRWHAESKLITPEAVREGITRAKAKDDSRLLTKVEVNTKVNGKVRTKTIQLNPETGDPYTLEERDQIMEARNKYRLKAHGRIDSDGHQRFSYPSPRDYLAFDPATGKITQNKPTGTVMLGLDEDTIKHLQKHPWQSPEWKDAYAQRNQVEASNKTLKGARAANLGDPASRTGRGFAYTYLVAIMAVVATNIRRIITGIINATTEVHDSTHPKVRARRRRDTKGQRLAPRVTAMSGGTAPPKPVP